jgi:hypothetical protein
MQNYETLRQEAKDHYALCERARAVGIPTSLDDPRGPKTVAALRHAVEAREEVDGGA